MPLLIFLAGAVALFVWSRTDQGKIVSETVTEEFMNQASSFKALFSTPYDSLIRESEIANRLPEGVLWKLLYQESHFRPDIITGKVTSPVGALGIAQFMPATAREWRVDPLDPSSAIPGAARYLRWLIDRTGSLDAGVAAYNWGIGNVQRQGLAKAPRETVNYVAAITGTDLTT
jgi:soluble lytic murein transglycosylase-like protein